MLFIFSDRHFYGERPLIALALVIGTLIELPVMVLVSQSLLRLRHRYPINEVQHKPRR
ncbi:MAG: hypothetical protein ACFCUV_12460 [Rivularia sp. (in: cyanobacteria)]